MKKLWLMVGLCLAAACIQWPTDEMIRANRCLVAPNECASDAGSVDAGASDAGEDAGLDAGVDAGPWILEWQRSYALEPKFLVGDQSGGTLISQTGLNFSLRGFTSAGESSTVVYSALGPEITAAYEREGIVVVGRADSQLQLWLRGGIYAPLVTRASDFITTAVDLYPLPTDGGPAVAAYGNQDGGLGLDSFEAETNQMTVGRVFITCDTTMLRPRRILPSPDGGPGVLVGNVDGNCGDGLDFNIDGGGGFVARFGFPVRDGYSFAASPNSPMALGIVENDLWVVYQAPGAQVLELANVRPMPPLLGIPLLAGNLTPVELVDIGADFVLVGHGSGTLSLLDGGLSAETMGEDVFIARMSLRGVTELHVFRAAGDQTVVGAVWTSERLVMAGTCDGSSAGLCENGDAGWMAGFRPAVP